MQIIINFVALSMLFAASGFAGNNTFQVKCVDSSGNPLKGVKVEIISLNDSHTSDEKSKNDGVATFKNADDGVYRVVGRKDDYAPALYEYLTLPSSGESVVLQLKPGDKDALLYFQDPARIQKSSELLAQGISAMKENKASEAEKMLQESIESDPSNVRAIFTLGTYYFQMTQFDRAIETLQKVEKLAGMFASLPPVPGTSDPSQQKQMQENAGKLIAAVPGYKGELALRQKKYGEAVKIFTEILQKNPNDVETYYQLAIALTYDGQLEKAMSTIDKAIEIKPDEKKFSDLKEQISARIENAAIGKAQADLDEGTKLLESGNAAGALEKFQQAIALLKPDKQAPVWRQIGVAQTDLKQFDSAEEAYKKAIELAPSKEIINYMNNLAQFYLKTKKYEKALDVLTDPRMLGGKSAEQALMDIADRTKNNDPEFAKIVLERALKADPRNMDACFLLGELYYIDYSVKDMDARAKELLTKYIGSGKDPEKVNKAKNMLVLINRRSK